MSHEALSRRVVNNAEEALICAFTDEAFQKFPQKGMEVIVIEVPAAFPIAPPELTQGLEQCLVVVDAEHRVKGEKLGIADGTAPPLKDVENSHAPAGIDRPSAVNCFWIFHFVGSLGRLRTDCSEFRQVGSLEKHGAQLNEDGVGV